jgi:hypothetical protein
MKADKIGRSERSHVIQGFKTYLNGISVGLYSPGSSVSPLQSYPENNKMPGEPSRKFPGNAGKTGMPSQNLEYVSIPVIFFSSKTGIGRKELWHWIEALVL